MIIEFSKYYLETKTNVADVKQKSDSQNASRCVKFNDKPYATRWVAFIWEICGRCKHMVGVNIGPIQIDFNWKPVDDNIVQTATELNGVNVFFCSILCWEIHIEYNSFISISIHISIENRLAIRC